MSGSAGAAIASQAVTKAAPSSATRAVAMRALSGAGLGLQAVHDVLRQDGRGRDQGGRQGRERSRQRSRQRQIDQRLRKAGG